MDQSRAYVCNYCAAVGVSMKYCSHCKAVSYCGTQCQRADWPRHQLVCSKAKSTKEPSQTTTTTQTNQGPETVTQPASNKEQAPQKTAAVSEPETAVVDASGDNQSTLFSPMVIASAAIVGLIALGAAAYTLFGGASEKKPHRGPRPPGRPPGPPPRRHHR